MVKAWTHQPRTTHSLSFFVHGIRSIWSLWPVHSIEEKLCVVSWTQTESATNQSKPLPRPSSARSSPHSACASPISSRWWAAFWMPTPTLSGAASLPTRRRATSSSWASRSPTELATATFSISRPSARLCLALWWHSASRRSLSAAKSAWYVAQSCSSRWLASSS